MKNMPEQTVLIDKPKEKILRFTLNRPEKRNALNDEIREELFDGLRQGDRDNETSVMIIRGAGEAFSAGYDLSQPNHSCLLYTSPSPRDKRQSRMPSSA